MLPKYGSHLDENRAAKCIVELDDETRDNIVGAADWALAGRPGRRVERHVAGPASGIVQRRTYYQIIADGPVRSQSQIAFRSREQLYSSKRPI